MKRIILIMMALVCMVPLQATITIPGISFTITAKTYDRATGTFYVGLNGNASALTLNQATRGVAPSFSGIGAEDNPIELLTLATNNIGIPAAALIYVTQNMMMDFSQDTLNSVSINTSNTQTGMVQLVDALGTNQDTAGIVGIASNASFAFAAVRPNPMQMNVNFGEIGSGIAIVGINPINFQLTQAAAVASSSAVQAFPLDQTIPPVNLPSTTSPGPANPTLFPNAEESYVNIIWDNPLQRLYVPLLEQLSTTSGSGGRDVVVGSFLDNTGTFTLTAIAPDSAFSLGSSNLIVGEIKNPTDPSQPYLSAFHARVMHCSTGPSYLIINGDIASTPNVNNLFYAIPLVDLGSPLNITQGTIADKNQFLINGKFTIPATTPFQMTFNTDLAAIIGGSPLPSDPTRPLVSDIVVLDDTVYVSLTSTTGPLNETGILYSQAQFDQTGKIHSWTPWTRRAFPYNGFVNSQSIFGPVLFFDVDAVTGSLWAVNGNGATPTTVVMTAWDAPETTLAPQIPNYTVNVSLTAELNKQFGTNPCTSVLDLDQSTAGFTNGALSYPYRYALFGGIGSVIFAVTSQAFNNTINSPQEVTVDYSQPGYLLATTVPTCLPITVMEYARQLPGTIDNYFFAGAADGLYVFDNGLGGSFDANSLGLLNAYPFIGHNWIKIDPTLMPGAILDIKTSGLALYVLTYTTSPTTPMQTTIYSIDFQPTVGAMFTASNIVTIAQSGTDVFSSVSLFTGMQIINPSNNADQLVITTNVGLYRSAKIGGVQAAISQTDANWQLIGTTTPYFNGIAAVDNASLVGSFSTKVWPFAFQSPTTAMIFNRSIWNQVCGTVSGAPYNFVPSFFNASDTSGAFATLPLTQYFWSDGGRRLAVTNPMKSVPACTNVRKTGVVCSPPQKCPSQQLFCLPFNTQEWAISGTSAQILSNSILDNYQRFYWIKDIGTTGILMVGTNSGVVALE